MQFQITNIEFDYDLDCNVDVDDYIGTIWTADDGDDLVEEITSDSGWCIKSIDYRHVLS
jgi:hypothetical protein